MKFLISEESSETVVRLKLVRSGDDKVILAADKGSGQFNLLVFEKTGDVRRCSGIPSSFGFVIDDRGRLAVI